MRRIMRLVLVLLLLMAVPFKVAVAASMVMCGPGHEHGMTALVAATGPVMSDTTATHMHDHGGHHLPGSAIDAHDDGAAGDIGTSEEEARKQHGDDVRVVEFSMKDNDRAQTERTTLGAVKVVARHSGKVLGVSILAAHAGELAHLWVGAIASGQKLTAVARMMAPYPTLGEANRSAASEFYKPKVFSALSRRIVRLFAHFP